jgi:hypothetical protein
MQKQCYEINDKIRDLIILMGWGKENECYCEAFNLINDITEDDLEIINEERFIIFLKCFKGMSLIKFNQLFDEVISKNEKLKYLYVKAMIQ